MWTEFLVRPLYNGLIGIMNILPWIDVGVAVIIFTAIVKIVLFPLSKSNIVTQARMKEVEPEAAKIRAQYSNDKQAQAKKIMELYKSKNIKPFAGFLLILIQFPILIALVSIFYKIIPELDTSLLYSFVSAPVLKTEFLGFIDLTQTSLILAIATAVLQYFQLQYSFSTQQKPKAVEPGAKPDMANMMSSMNTQMKYMLPILAFASIYWIIPASSYGQAASIVAVYWMTSCLMTLLQELYIRKRLVRSGKVERP